ncbi:hypothetical protein KA344_02415 [bacterium]|nr:hypothetical protein [bacterium]
MFSKVAGHRGVLYFDDVACFMKANLDESCYGTVIDPDGKSRCDLEIVGFDKGSTEQRLF